MPADTRADQRCAAALAALERQGLRATGSELPRLIGRLVAAAVRLDAIAEPAGRPAGSATATARLLPTSAPPASIPPHSAAAPLPPALLQDDFQLVILLELDDCFYCTSSLDLRSPCGIPSYAFYDGQWQSCDAPSDAAGRRAPSAGGGSGAA